MVDKPGDRIRQFRKAGKMTLEELGEKINFSTGYLSNVERNAVGPSSNLLIKLHEIFNLSSDYILYGTSPETIMPQMTASGAALKDLLDQIISNKGPQEQQGVLTLPILQLSKAGMTENLKPDLLIIQNRIFGRRKNFIPIRIDGDDQVNIILLEKNLGGQTQK